MSVITFIRHGQANSSATTEEGYDNLSDLGKTQARWLGEHLRHCKVTYDAVYTGTLNRQIDTEALLDLYDSPDPIQDPRLNEFRYYDLIAAMEKQFDLKPPLEGTGFINHFLNTFTKWKSGELQDIPETWDTYENRVWTMMEDMRHSGKNVLAVTSGGVIGMAAAHALRLDVRSLVKVLLEGMNTGVTRFQYLHGEYHLMQFNNLPHLEDADRVEARTYY